MALFSEQDEFVCDCSNDDQYAANHLDKRHILPQNEVGKKDNDNGIDIAVNSDGLSRYLWQSGVKGNIPQSRNHTSGKNEQNRGEPQWGVGEQGSIKYEYVKNQEDGGYNKLHHNAVKSVNIFHALANQCIGRKKHRRKDAEHDT